MVGDEGMHGLGLPVQRQRLNQLPYRGGEAVGEGESGDELLKEIRIATETSPTTSHAGTPGSTAPITTPVELAA
jgi:hypothetical protein